MKKLVYPSNFVFIVVSHSCYLFRSIFHRHVAVRRNDGSREKSTNTRSPNSKSSSGKEDDVFLKWIEAALSVVPLAGCSTRAAGDFHSGAVQCFAIVPSPYCRLSACQSVSQYLLCTLLSSIHLYCIDLNFAHFCIHNCLIIFIQKHIYDIVVNYYTNTFFVTILSLRIFFNLNFQFFRFWIFECHLNFFLF